jgi:hypothetical protein
MTAWHFLFSFQFAALVVATVLVFNIYSGATALHVKWATRAKQQDEIKMQSLMLPQSEDSIILDDEWGVRASGIAIPSATDDPHDAENNSVPHFRNTYATRSNTTRYGAAPAGNTTAMEQRSGSEVGADPHPWISAGDTSNATTEGSFTAEC